LKKKNILIVGGTGFIGFHLAKKCIKKGYLVTSISSNKPSKTRLIKNVKYLICDVRNYHLLTKTIKRSYNYVVNLSGYVDHSKKKITFQSHFYGCKNLANIFKHKKIESFIQLGSSLEYGNIKSPQKENSKCKPRSIYGKSKFMATKYLKKLFVKNNLPVNILRLYQAYGPNQTPNRLIPLVIKSCLNKNKFDCSDGKQIRDFIYIDDLINLIIKIFNSKKHYGEIINVGSGRPIKIKKIIQLINKIIKSGEPNFGKIKMRKDEITSMYPNINKAKKLFNWEPKIKILIGLKKTIKFYDKNK